MKRMKLIISGRVQGVGYRAFARREASKIGIKGYVKNLPDGTVEVVAEASEKKLDKFLSQCKKGSFLARVDHVDISHETPTGAFEKFQVEF